MLEHHKLVEQAEEIAHLRAEVTRLARELSDARQALLRGDRVTQDDMKWLLQERDALRAQLKTVTRENGRLTDVLLSRHGGEPLTLLDELDTARSERDALRACVTQLAGALRLLETAGPRARMTNDELCIVCEATDAAGHRTHTADCEIGNALILAAAAEKLGA